LAIPERGTACRHRLIVVALDKVLPGEPFEFLRAGFGVPRLRRHGRHVEARASGSYLLRKYGTSTAPPRLLPSFAPLKLRYSWSQGTKLLCFDHTFGDTQFQREFESGVRQQKRMEITPGSCPTISHARSAYAGVPSRNFGSTKSSYVWTRDGTPVTEL
jgi:hypothetical protein